MQFRVWNTHQNLRNYSFLKYYCTYKFHSFNMIIDALDNNLIKSQILRGKSFTNVIIFFFISI